MSVGNHRHHPNRQFRLLKRRDSDQPRSPKSRLAPCPAARSGRCLPRRRTVSGGSSAPDCPPTATIVPPDVATWPSVAWMRPASAGGHGEVRRGRARRRVSRVERRGSGPAPVVRACHHDHRDADRAPPRSAPPGPRPSCGTAWPPRSPCRGGRRALFRQLVRRVAQPARMPVAARPSARGPAARRRAVVRPAVRRGPGPLLVRRFERSRGSRDRWLAAARAARAA